MVVTSRKSLIISDPAPMTTSKQNVVLALRGGLGNQIYQLCALDYVRDSLLIPAVVDLSHYNLIKNSRTPSLLNLLDILGISLDYPTQAHYSTLLIEKIHRKAPLISRAFCLRTVISELQSLEKSGDSTSLLLAGYFQLHETLVRSRRISLMRRMIIKRSIYSSIAIHLRLGDYQIPPYNSLYWLATSAYVSKALGILSDRGVALSEDRIRVFSDNQTSAAEILCAAGLTSDMYYFGPIQDPEYDLMDLACYRYKVLSNSTFSLASHYLGSSVLSIVPRYWFKSVNTPRELFPPDNESSNLILVDNS